MHGGRRSWWNPTVTVSFFLPPPAGGKGVGGEKRGRGGVSGTGSPHRARPAISDVISLPPRPPPPTPQENQPPLHKSPERGAARGPGRTVEPAGSRQPRRPHPRAPLPLPPPHFTHGQSPAGSSPENFPTGRGRPRLTPPPRPAGPPPPPQKRDGAAGSGRAPARRGAGASSAARTGLGGRAAAPGRLLARHLPRRRSWRQGRACERRVPGAGPARSGRRRGCGSRRGFWPPMCRLRKALADGTPPPLPRRRRRQHPPGVARALGPPAPPPPAPLPPRRDYRRSRDGARDHLSAICPAPSVTARPTPGRRPQPIAPRLTQPTAPPPRMLPPRWRRPAPRGACWELQFAARRGPDPSGGARGPPLPARPLAGPRRGPKEPTAGAALPRARRLEAAGTARPGGTRRLPAAASAGARAPGGRTRHVPPPPVWRRGQRGPARPRRQSRPRFGGRVSRCGPAWRRGRQTSGRNPPSEPGEAAGTEPAPRGLH